MLLSSSLVGDSEIVHDGWDGLPDPSTCSASNVPAASFTSFKAHRKGPAHSSHCAPSLKAGTTICTVQYEFLSVVFAAEARSAFFFLERFGLFVVFYFFHSFKLVWPIMEYLIIIFFFQPVSPPTVSTKLLSRSRSALLRSLAMLCR